MTMVKHKEYQDRNQMFQPIFARGPWLETFKASLSPTNRTANKRRRQMKRVKIFLNFTYLHKAQPEQKTAGNVPNFLKISTRQMFGYPVLDAGENTSHFPGDISILIDETCRIFSRLVYATSIQSGDKTSFQFYNLFRTMKTCAMNAKSSIIQKFP